jgi:VWFA-related protein
MRRAVAIVAAGMLAAGAADAASTGGVTSATQKPQATDARTRSLYVSVVDGKGDAVTGLTVRDFTVREDGVTREVLRAEPATEPLDIVVLVDDSQAATAAIPYIRDGLTKFVDRLQGKAKIGIVTIGERPTSVAESTTDVAALKKGINRIFPRPGSGAYLLEGINEVVRGVRLREAQRPVIVALTVEGIEYSNLQYERVVSDLLASGAALHALAIGSPVPSASDEIRNRNLVLAQGTEQSGGRRDQLLSPMAVQERLQQLAGELVNQYVVTYSRPEALIQPEKVQVGVNKPGLTARARTRLPQKK